MASKTKTVANYKKFQTEMGKLISDPMGFTDKDENEIKDYFKKWGKDAMLEIHYDNSGRLMELKSRLGDQRLELWKA